MVRQAVAKALQLYAGATGQVAVAAVSGATTKGKIYEAHVLSRVIEKLHIDEQCSLGLIGSGTLRLRTSPGLIDRMGYAYFTVQHPAGYDWELWTDLEIVGLSVRLGHVAPSRVHANELDLVVVNAGVTGRPDPDSIHVGIECKHRPFSKNFMRSILGIRRQLSLLDYPVPTAFDVWPMTEVPARPPSCLMLYSTDLDALRHDVVGDPFGILVVHEPV